ncbi:alanine racemase [uncultured Tateyamaria sp.]|uniref:alanine racemase n=1 Tax=uncultured Tateyamaria sp. TaxID=455651 RepID=UPI002617C681|nr:alanine racemase [uncultured Tateyamaria sp.]
MTSATLTIDLGAVVRNWRALDAMSEGETGAVVKADAYGLGAAPVGQALRDAGVRNFFVATAGEGMILRDAIGHGLRIYVFSGHMEGDTDDIRAASLTPLLNSVDQMLRHVEALPGAPFGIQLDTGMNRLGMEPAEWSAVRDIAIAQRPALIMSHLACADEPDHAMNTQQLEAFRAMTDGIDIPRSLAATGGTLLGTKYHFDMTRPGVGLYGGLPFVDAEPVVTLDLPVIQVREVPQGETVGYANGWTAQKDSRIATVSGGYADGLIRAMGGKAALYAGDTRCPVVGRVSMDLITADVSALAQDPTSLQLMGRHQSVDTVADAAGTIGYEILTQLGQRYGRTLLA